MKNYRLEMTHTMSGDIISTKTGRILGHVKKTEDLVDPEWAAFEFGHVGFSHPVARTAEKAAFYLVERLEEQRKHRKSKNKKEEH